MIVKHTDIYFGIPCYLPDGMPVNKSQAIPLCTLIAALDEGLSIEKVAEEYKIAPKTLLELVEYVKEYGTN